jgi:hypothetical protein
MLFTTAVLKLIEIPVLDKPNFYAKINSNGTLTFFLVLFPFQVEV